MLSEFQQFVDKCSNTTIYAIESFDFSKTNKRCDNIERWFTRTVMCSCFLFVIRAFYKTSTNQKLQSSLEACVKSLNCRCIGTTSIGLNWNHNDIYLPIFTCKTGFASLSRQHESWVSKAMTMSIYLVRKLHIYFCISFVNINFVLSLVSGFLRVLTQYWNFHCSLIYRYHFSFSRN